MVVEARSHAEGRGAPAYARISKVVTDRRGREAGEVRGTLLNLFEHLQSSLPAGPLPILSGASGAEPATAEEADFLDFLPAWGVEPIVRAYGSRLGHGVEAHFPAGVLLAALAVSRDVWPLAQHECSIERPLAGPVERVLVTGVGHWRGEGLALVEPVSSGQQP